MATGTRATQYLIDANLQLKDAGLVAASAAATVSASAQILDLVGSGLTLGQDTAPAFSADVLIDVSAIEIASNDENYRIVLEGSDSATFASGIEELVSISLGALETLSTDTDVDSDVGRYVMSWNGNGRNGRKYRYVRLYTVVAGTIATGINYAAWLVPQKIGG